MGHIAIGQMNKGQIVDTNRNLAKAGLILGWVFTGLWAVGFAFYAVLLVWIVGEGYNLYM